MSKETWSQEGMQCPNCNEVNMPDDAADYSEDETVQYCSNCDKEFISICFVSQTWTSRPCKP
ncbi:hypothetical protein NVP1046O_06 [Vibrio phage 1.046.O._10N.286.52.E3]|nr:hypothetical protein NVP1046O_06 [Vibrio phage 1.046.O._10N.286.52.E3]